MCTQSQRPGDIGNVFSLLAGNSGGVWSWTVNIIKISIRFRYIQVPFGLLVRSLACGVCAPAKSKPPRLLLSLQGHFLLSSVWCMRADHYWSPGPNTGSCLLCCQTPFCQVMAGLWVSQGQWEFNRSLLLYIVHKPELRAASAPLRFCSNFPHEHF